MGYAASLIKNGVGFDSIPPDVDGVRVTLGDGNHIDVLFTPTRDGKTLITHAAHNKSLTFSCPDANILFMQVKG